MQNPNDYISFTVINMTTYDEAYHYAEYRAAVYEFDLLSKEVTEVFSFPLNAMYALGVYDKKSNSVYYSKEQNNESYERKRTGDQIYAYNLATETDTMLTDDLIAVNYIIPVDDCIFFVAARNSNPSSLSLGKIDLSDGNVKYWDEPDTASTRTISVDRIRKRIYVAIFDTVEEDIFLAADLLFDPPKYTVCSFDYNLNDKMEVLHKDNSAIIALYAIDNLLLCRADNTLAPLPETTTMSEVIDLADMRVLFQSAERFSQRGCFTHDKKGAYILDADSDYMGIYHYDFETQVFTPIIKSDSVVNFQLMY